MWESLRNLKRSELTVSDELSRLEREWLVGCLVSKIGIREALYKDGDSHQLIVEYDSDQVSGTRVVDLIESCGVRAHASPPFDFGH